MSTGIIEFVAGPLLGGVFGWLGREQDFKVKKLDLEANRDKYLHELQLVNANRMSKHEENEDKMSFNREATDQELSKINTTGSWSGLEASIRAEAALGPTKTFMDGFRSSVRPVLTYASIMAATTLCWFAVEPEMSRAASLSLITNASMAFAWWFGDRPSMKANPTRYTKG